MITQDEAIELAREVGLAPSWKGVREMEVDAEALTEELTAFANAVRKQTLLEAAETWETIGYSKFKTPAEELRRMAGVE